MARDGRDGKNGKRGPVGPAGPPGKDLTNPDPEKFRPIIDSMLAEIVSGLELPQGEPGQDGKNGRR